VLGKFLDLGLAYKNNAAVDVLLNGKMALSVSLPFVQEIYCRRAVELDDNTVAYDDLRERFIQFDQLIANDHRLPFVVGSALVNVIAREGASRDLNTRVEEYVRWLKS